MFDEISRHCRSLPREVRPHITAKTKHTSDHVRALNDSADAFRNFEHRVITHEIIARAAAEPRTELRCGRRTCMPEMPDTEVGKHLDLPTLLSRDQISCGV